MNCINFGFQCFFWLKNLFKIIIKECKLDWWSPEAGFFLIGTINLLSWKRRRDSDLIFCFVNMKREKQIWKFSLRSFLERYPCALKSLFKMAILNSLTLSWHLITVVGQLKKRGKIVTETVTWPGVKYFLNQRFFV